MSRLLRRPQGRLRGAEIVRWWELRRLPYNAIVGAVSSVSAIIMLAVAFTCESRGGAAIGLPDPPLFAIAGFLLYGILANLCYTGGWVVELLVTKVWHVDTAPFGPIAVAIGTAFSVLITLIPPGMVIVVASITSCRGF